MPVVEVGSTPLQLSPPAPPLAVQAVAFVVPQLRVVDWPACRVVGDAARPVIDGGGVATPTVTETEEVPLAPPGPVQLSVYVTVPIATTGPTLWPLLDAVSVPVQESAPVPPVAVHDVALLLDHASEVE
jgi:hypothetical protein